MIMRKKFIEEKNLHQYKSQKNNNKQKKNIPITSINKPQNYLFHHNNSLYNSQMLFPSKTHKQPWSKRDIDIISKYKQRIRDIEQQNLEQKLINKEVNSIEFYNITPKQELPKFLQKMKFQTLHSKQNVSKVVKIFKKVGQTPDEKAIRNKLRNDGGIMFLSEIYQNLAEPTQQLKHTTPSGPVSKFVENFGTDLQEWQKTKNSSMMEKLMVMRRRHPHQSPRHKQSRIIEEKLSELHRNNSSGRAVNYFKEGSNYKKQIEKQLDIIYYTHSSEPNQVNKYILIENSSKLLKKQLDERQLQVEEEIKSKMKILNETRIQHHNLFDQKARLTLEQRQYHEQIVTKEQYGIPITSGNSTYFAGSTNNKIIEIKTQKRQHIEQNEIKIMKNKRMIESLENAIQNSEDELRSIMVGEISYFKMTLKVGMDCKDTGLGWVLKKLRALLVNTRDKDTTQQPASLTTTTHKEQEYEFPLYLDKKSKQFLILKTHLEDQLEQLMEQKRKFVNEIGQSQQPNGSSAGYQDTPISRGAIHRTTINAGNGAWVCNTSGLDKIVEQDNTSDIPKKYRRSLRKITILNQQFAKNQSLLEFKTRKLCQSKNLDLSTNTDGLSGKRLYETITQKIKFFDFTKAKKDKSLALKNSKLLEYQNLLKSIKDIHMKLEDIDIQHENHLTSHYKENKEVFFEQCAACFGYKKSYSMIIKYFSWKNGGEEGNNV